MSATASWRHVSLSLSEFPLPVVSSLVPISLGNLSQFESTRVGWRGRGRVDKRSEIGEVHNSFFVCRELHRRRPGQNLHYFPPNTPPPTTSHSGASQRPLLVPRYFAADAARGCFVRWRVRALQLQKTLEYSLGFS